MALWARPPVAALGAPRRNAGRRWSKRGPLNGQAQTGALPTSADPQRMTSKPRAGVSSDRRRLPLSIRRVLLDLSQRASTATLVSRMALRPQAPEIRALRDRGGESGVTR